MTNQTSNKDHKVFWKTVVCVSLSAFYIAMLAWPFGLSEQGYMVSRALLAGSVMFAISIPAWIINIKRELYSKEAAETSKADAKEQMLQKIGQLAMNNKWLSPDEVRQVMFCQKADGEKFGQVAVKRNFLTLSQVKALLSTQSGMKEERMETADL